MQQGKFLVSLDFEMMWGVRDKRTIASYGKNIKAVRCVIPRLLSMAEDAGYYYFLLCNKKVLHGAWMKYSYLGDKNPSCLFLVDNLKELDKCILKVYNTEIDELPKEVRTALMERSQSNIMTLWNDFFESLINQCDMLKVEAIVTSIFDSITCLLSEKEGSQVCIVDCGDVSPILEKVGCKRIASVLLTHAHFDYIYGLPEFMQLNP